MAARRRSPDLAEILDRRSPARRARATGRCTSPYARTGRGDLRSNACARSGDLRTGRRAEGGSTVAQDVAGLKGLVEQQTEVLSALVNALTGGSSQPERSREFLRFLEPFL
jgi:hypothetical protein